MASTRAIDTQQELVYRWESEFPTWNKANLAEADCIRLIDWACDLYKIPHPKIIFHENRRGYSWSQGRPQYTISIQDKHRNMAVCLHEAAHLIHAELLGDSKDCGHEGHGPEWLALYVWLLVRAGVSSRRAIECSLRDIGLKWVEPAGLLSPRRLRKTYRKLYREQKKRLAADAGLVLS